MVVRGSTPGESPNIGKEQAEYNPLIKISQEQPNADADFDMSIDPADQKLKKNE